MFRIIKELRPSYVIGENVARLLSMENGETLKQILFDLENEGYNNEIFLIPACSIGADHRRNRLWIIAYANSLRCNDGKNSNRQYNKSSISDQSKNSQKNDKKGEPKSRIGKNIKTITDIDSKRMERISKRSILRKQNIQDGQISQPFQEANTRFNTFESRLCRTLHGLPFGVDRIKALGNAIVPQVAYELFNAITQIDNG